MGHKPAPDDIEIVIGPHSARHDWSVLRVTYQRKPDHEQRVSRAVSALFPQQPIERASVERATSSKRARRDGEEVGASA